MSWALRFHPAVKKDLRRLSPERRNFILGTMLPAIAADPFRGEPLHGPLKGFWKYQIGDDRIAYAINVKLREVTMLQIGPRGGFYQRLRKRLKM